VTAATRANALPILIAASVIMSLAMGMRQCLKPALRIASATTTVALKLALRSPGCMKMAQVRHGVPAMPQSIRNSAGINMALAILFVASVDLGGSLVIPACRKPPRLPSARA
jgi:hypothetical protein